VAERDHGSTPREAHAGVANAAAQQLVARPLVARWPAWSLLDGRRAAMEVVHERCAGIDISKTNVKVCVRVPGAGKRCRREVRTFTTMTADLLAMRDWLLAERVPVVGMEATGAYWKPVFYLLEAGVLPSRA
jgi:hypothetical protein